MRRSTRGLALVLVLALAGPGTPVAAAGRAVVTQVGVKVFPDRVQVGVVASRPVSYQTRTLTDPDRVVVDIAGATNGLAWAVQPVHQGPVAQVRVGQFQETPPIVRVVVDLIQPTRYEVTMPSPTIVAIGLLIPTSRSGALSSAQVVQTPPPAGVQGARPAGAQGPAGAASQGALPGGSTAGGPVSAGPGIVMVRQPGPGAEANPRLNLDLRDAALTDVLDALARLCGFNLVTDASVGGKVTIHLVGVTCSEALTFLLEANALAYRRVGETLIVQAASKLAPPPPGPVVRVYHLQYLQPPLSGLEPLVGGGAGTVPGGAGPVRKDVGVLVDLFRGTGATVGYDDRTNSLVVTGTPAQQEAVAALLGQLDVPIGQVTVEAVVVDITSTSLRSLGVEWGSTSGIGTITFTETVPPPGLLGVQPITRDALFARLHALVTQGNAKVLSDPRIATFDGQEALIFAGDQIPIVNTTVAGNPPVTTETVTFQAIGVTLKIIPKVNADRTISVQIHPVVTTAPSFTPATLTNPQGLPIIATREAVTSLRVGDGESIILGGLMKFSDIKNLTKLPLLGDLPFIGSLFRFSTVNHQESEVVIVMTPRILAVPPAQAVTPATQ